MTWFVTLAAVATGVAAVATCAATTVGRRVSVVTVAIGLATVGLATFAVLVLGVGFRGLDLFGIAHVLYLQATLAVPLLGAGLLVLGWRRRISTAGVVVSLALLVPAPVGIWASHVAPFRLRVDRLEVPVTDAGDGQGAVRVAVLADLQTTGIGDHERAAVRAILDARPDVILVPGDLFQADEDVLATQGPAVRDLLAQLEAPGGVYSVQGDVDSAVRLAAVVPPNVTQLDDQVVEVRIRDRRVRIGGTRLDVTTPAAEQVRRDLAADDGALTILMSHRPDTVLQLPPDSGVDLTVSGHTHGGQIALPLFGPPVTLSAVPRSVGAGGLHQVAGNTIYVSTGVGMERGQAPQVRFLVPPSIGLLDLG
jgi:predicted MPP superfamily phosphohydrolase